MTLEVYTYIHSYYTVHPYWVDSLIRNSCIASMPSTMYGVFRLFTFSRGHDSKMMTTVISTYIYIYIYMHVKLMWLIFIFWKLLRRSALTLKISNKNWTYVSESEVDVSGSKFCTKITFLDACMWNIFFITWCWSSYLRNNSETRMFKLLKAGFRPHKLH